MNTGVPLFPSLLAAEQRVVGIQTKLHRWASQDTDRQFDDLFE